MNSYVFSDFLIDLPDKTRKIINIRPFIINSHCIRLYNMYSNISRNPDLFFTLTLCLIYSRPLQFLCWLFLISSQCRKGLFYISGLSNPSKSNYFPSSNNLKFSTSFNYKFSKFWANIITNHSLCNTNLETLV